MNNQLILDNFLETILESDKETLIVLYKKEVVKKKSAAMT